MGTAEGKQKRKSKNKKALGLCPIKFCRNKKGNKKKYCEKHARRAYTAKNPLGVKWEQLKESAKRRAARYQDPERYAFTITRANFIDWATFYGFQPPGGYCGETLTVDRKNANFGYHIWNIAPLKMRENSAKGKKSYVQYYQENPHLLTDGETPEDYAIFDFEPFPIGEECPF